MLRYFELQAASQYRAIQAFKYFQIIKAMCTPGKKKKKDTFVYIESTHILYSVITLILFFLSVVMSAFTRAYAIYYIAPKDTCSHVSCLVLNLPLSLNRSR